jgi:hypothetical protein
MRILRKLFGGLMGAPVPAVDQAVVVALRLSGTAFGSGAEARKIHHLGDALEKAVTQAGAGTFDGEEFDELECQLLFSGPDADAIWRAVEPLLRSSALARGAHATLRYGAAGSRERSVVL